MKKTNKLFIKLQNNTEVEAQAPTIISASRSTDIPAFYLDWFFHRMEIGYSAWINPFNGVKSYISYQNVKFIVFWSKNPKPLLDKLSFLKRKNITYYIQYTLNDYVIENLEQGVPSLEERIETFKKLSNELGKKSVIWRFDPLILTDKISISCLLSKIENIGNQLYGYTDRFIFSFADILEYKKVKANLDRNKIHYINWNTETMLEMAKGISELNKKWKFKLFTCAENINLDLYNIQHAHCIDDELIAQLAYTNHELIDYLGLTIKQKTLTLLNMPSNDEIILNDNLIAIRNKNKKDKGQRNACGCISSKDIGEYNTCPHLCEYCYANTSKEIALRNYATHKLNPFSETITGK
ncbi:DUF1848 domain-containing protein [Brachyspira sp.]|uniref:DUF1848 domain-containing protein n=1 Tax=Brachyspira sp. TaxID=1977261 RepID=UPI0026343968|nr:DUF1848 domain-containing protein [Brachyspira sp.]